MLDRRHSNESVTPEYEDSGLFKGPTTRLGINVTPKISRNDRNDLIVLGYAENNIEIEVVFAGRRRPLADPLVHVLKHRWTKATKAAEASGNFPKPEQVRFPIHVVGAWRPRFENDDQGWMSRSYQLLVAQWFMVDAKGNQLAYGESPKRSMLRTAAQKALHQHRSQR